MNSLSAFTSALAALGALALVVGALAWILRR